MIDALKFKLFPLAVGVIIWALVT